MQGSDLLVVADVADQAGEQALTANPAEAHAEVAFGWLAHDNVCSTRAQVADPGDQVAHRALDADRDVARVVRVPERLGERALGAPSQCGERLSLNAPAVEEGVRGAQCDHVGDVGSGAEAVVLLPDLGVEPLRPARRGRGAHREHTLQVVGHGGRVVSGGDGLGIEKGNERITPGRDGDHELEETVGLVVLLRQHGLVQQRASVCKDADAEHEVDEEPFELRRVPRAQRVGADSELERLAGEAVGYSHRARLRGSG